MRPIFVVFYHFDRKVVLKIIMDVPISLNPPPVRLRIIRDGAREADFNMAADRYLLDCAADNNQVILRIYSWLSPTITLGCMQKAEFLLDAKAMESIGVGWISRLTGGRAVLHWNDLTYSFAFPISIVEMGRSISESYAVIGRCLSAGFQLAGVAAELHDSSTEHGATAPRNLRLPCFCSPNRNEIMVHGRKLVGSAQKRTYRAVLQHGSIPLGRQFRRLGELMAAPAEEREQLCKLLDLKCTCMRDIAPTVGENALAEYLAAGFARTLSFERFEQSWTAQELIMIKQIIDEKKHVFKHPTRQSADAASKTGKFPSLTARKSTGSGH
jgi:lipoate-protein ligase A